MFFVILLYALFASVFTVSKTGLQYADPLFFVGTRMLLAGILLLGYQYFFRREEFRFEWSSMGRILLLALFNIYLTNVFEFWGLQHLTSFKTCFLYSLSPFLSALFSYFIFSEKVTGKKWLGLLVGCAGFFPILLSLDASEEAAGQIFFFSWPEIYVLMAAATSVYGWILLKQLVSENGYSPIMANGLSMFFGGAMALSHSALTESWQPFPVREYTPFVICTVLLIIISNLVAYNLYGFLLRRFSATFVSFAGFTTPLFTALFGWLFLGEVTTMAFWLSLAVVFVGLFLFHQEELKVAALREIPDQLT